MAGQNLQMENRKKTECKTRFQTDVQIKMKTKYEDEGSENNWKGSVPISIERVAFVPISIEREAFADTMVDISDRREPCSPSVRRPN